ncbi:MAG: histidine phosphatase family protein [Aeromicrobium sp.]|nr:histidine phosphatase family protein [Aeromicrobium sp.]
MSRAELDEVEDQLWLVRHGETEWSKSGRHTSTTDLPLTEEGEAAALKVAPALAGLDFVQVLTSPRQRARHTAELAGFPGAKVDADLAEWAYGEYEGRTSVEIRKTDPGWTIWSHPTPGGETADQVAARMDRVVARARAADGKTLVFGHGHALRALAARWLGLDVSEGRLLVLDTATISVLGVDRGVSVVRHWNVIATG